MHPPISLWRSPPLVAVGLVALLCAAGGGRALAAERPNIVFLFSDDQTARAVGCYGNTDVITPNLDRLARDGVRFTNHYNTTSICMASRCSVLTGVYEYRHGCNFEHGDLERRFVQQSYPVLLRQAGYFTGFAGKIGFVLQGEKFEALTPLFDEWAEGPGQTFYETAKNEGIARYADEYPHCSRAYGGTAAGTSLPRPRRRCGGFWSNGTAASSRSSMAATFSGWNLTL